MLKAAEKRPDMYEGIKKAWKWIEDADAVLIGASNGLSITEGLHLFADNQAFEELFGDLKRKVRGFAASFRAWEPAGPRKKKNGASGAAWSTITAGNTRRRR